MCPFFYISLLETEMGHVITAPRFCSCSELGGSSLQNPMCKGASVLICAERGSCVCGAVVGTGVLACTFPKISVAVFITTGGGSRTECLPSLSSSCQYL